MFRHIFLVTRLALSLLGVATLMAGIRAAPCHADAIQEYTAKSVLALNLARFTEWPAETFKDDAATLNLCFLGDDVVQQAFVLVDKKPVGDKILLVRSINQTKSLDKCQLLYISTDAAIPPNLFDESYRRNLLTIGETDDFLSRGGMVYLEMSTNKINIHINLAATKKAGVQISSRVLKLAIIFNP